MESLAISAQDTEEIIRVCTYHRWEFDDLLVVTPESKVQLPSLETTFSRSTSSSLGNLDRLPDELLLAILRELDIESYLLFRGVNSRARDLATTNHEYALLVKHGLEGLKAMLRVQMGHLFTLGTVYQTFVNPKCISCGKFGTFLSLLTCQRCCFTCIQISPDMAVFTIPVLKSLCKALGVSKADIQSACGPKLEVAYGKYGSGWTRWSKVDMARYLVSAKDTVERLRSVRTTRPVRDSDVRHEPGHQRNRHYLTCSYRYMATTAFPCYDLSHNRVEKGVSCKGCAFRVNKYRSPSSPPWGFNDRDRVYSTEEFLIHFGKCEHGQKVWESFQERQVIEWSSFTREGGQVIDHDRSSARWERAMSLDGWAGRVA